MTGGGIGAGYVATMRRFLVPLMFTLLVALTGAFGPIGSSVEAGPLAAPIAQTLSGPVRGVRGEGYRAFLGIPYAAPPVGQLRWQPPQPHAPWTKPRDATTRPPRCVQRTPGVPLASQEDCLYLNVHTPDPQPRNAPVMVWIHGGGFMYGEGVQTDGGTAGDRLAQERGVVVVSMNYRLGAFGFLARPGDDQSGNFGLQDQQAALRWVHDNIARFGGDPNDVTLFGESAGGLSVCEQLVSPSSEGLFSRAIVESGMCGQRATTKREAEQDTGELVRRLGCDGKDAAACMRELPAGAILEASREMHRGTGNGIRHPWRPYVDGSVVPGAIRDQVAAGKFHHVPIIVGWNGDEGTLDMVFSRFGGDRVDASRFRTLIRQLATHNHVSAQDVMAQYPLDAYPDPGEAAADAIGHATLACPSRSFARLLAEQGADVHVYRFSYRDAGFQIPFVTGLGAFHSAEIQYIFGHPAPILQSKFHGTDQRLHQAMAGYWTRFAATGDPNGGDAPYWPANDAGHDAHLVLDRTVHAAQHADAQACSVWGE